MKRIITIIITIVLLLGLAQCKKQETPATADGKWVHITMKVADGAKHIVYPNTGAVLYSEGDVIYVGNGGHYVGSLTYTDGVFSGDIQSPVITDHLHFYFVGGCQPSAAPSEGSTTDFTVSIADQSSKLPVLSYGHSTQKYTDGTATYSCMLENKCGLVKFVPATATDETVTVGGMKTTATIDFATPNITPTATTGNVTIYAESNAAKWAILLVQDEVSTPTVTIAGYESSITSVPAVSENMYYTTGVNITMTEAPYIDAEFTVASGTTVKFSKGNLQYQGSTDKFRFAENQYDVVGNAAGNTAPSASQSAWIDLFGWGTSGYNSKYPYMTSTTNSNYGDGANDIAGTNYDWGVYNRQSNQNKIEGGGDHAWRTLTRNEWVYVVNERSTTSGHRYAKAQVCGIKGLMLFPDNWSDDTYTFTNYNAGDSKFFTPIDASSWATLESAGCVFLPIAGRRTGTSVDNVGSIGYYWSSTCSGGSNDYALRVGFDSGYVNPNRSDDRKYGYSVRLVF